MGEYQFIENGIKKVNSLEDFDDTNIKGYDHNFNGGVFLNTLPSYWIDKDEIHEIKVELFIQHPNDGNIEGVIILRYVNDYEIEKLQVCIRDESTLADHENSKLDIPDGNYEFVKQ